MFKTKRRQSVPRDSVAATYGSGEVARLTGISLRQLQWWDERKVIMPEHEGHKRIYTRQDAIEISLIGELRRKGFSLQKIRRVLRFLQREVGKRLSQSQVHSEDLQLLTDGKSIYLEYRNDRIVDILKDARQPMFLVCVSDQVRRLDAMEPLVPRKGVAVASESTVRRAVKTA